MAKNNEIPPKAAIIAFAIRRCGGSANLRDIYKEVRRLNPDWMNSYKNEESFEGSVRATIEAHCPQSDNFRFPDLPLFAWEDAGRYHVVPSEQWPAAASKRKPLGGNKAP